MVEDSSWLTIPIWLMTPSWSTWLRTQSWSTIPIWMVTPSWSSWLRTKSWLTIPIWMMTPNWLDWQIYHIEWLLFTEMDGHLYEWTMLCVQSLLRIKTNLNLHPTSEVVSKEVSSDRIQHVHLVGFECHCLLIEIIPRIYKINIIWHFTIDLATR